jgi:FMN phosphatase YigB (HAD superfamily)
VYFFDDSVASVALARALGMEAFHVDGQTSLAASLIMRS